MWRKLSIKVQLMIWISAVTFMIAFGSLGIAFWLDVKQRETLAVSLSTTVNSALRHDLLKGILSNDASVYSDLSFRLAGFQQIDRVLLLNDQNKPVFNYLHTDKTYQNLVDRSTETPQFHGEDLFVKHPLIEDGYQYGSAVYVIDMMSFSTQFEKHLIFLFIALPLELLLALLFTWWISRSYNQPFTQLVEAMKRNDVGLNQFSPVHTDAKNEIGALFNGYNEMIHKVEATTEQMRYLSEHDDLTGLYNRYYIELLIQKALQDETAQHHVLLNIDLDQFKLINDAAGHSAGDELLKMVAHSCQDMLPDSVSMARIGGDDFYILLPNHSEKIGKAIAETLLEHLSDFRFSWEGQAYSVSASIGMVAFKPFEYTLEELVKAADSAFYSAKSAGRKKLHIFHSEDEESQYYKHEVQIASYIKEALAQGASPTPSKNTAYFELFAQGITPLQHNNHDKISYEILIRLRDMKGNLIAPDAFLPTAERYQMMADIDGFVLTQYLNRVQSLPTHLTKLHKAHINLAGSSLNNADFQTRLKQLVSEHPHFPWRKLELEITETSAVGNFNQAMPFIQYCQALGIGLALDDFGTGMSSFEYLKSLPFDVIKIDGSFVKDMHSDPSDKAVIRYIQEISALRNQETVAEYVETQEDVDVLTEIGITYGQGYFLGRPKPLTEWLT